MVPSSPFTGVQLYIVFQKVHEALPWHPDASITVLSGSTSGLRILAANGRSVLVLFRTVKAGCTRQCSTRAARLSTASAANKCAGSPSHSAHAASIRVKATSRQRSALNDVYDKEQDSSYLAAYHTRDTERDRGSCALRPVRVR